MELKNLRLIAIFVIVSVLLLIPYAAMKLGVGFNWSGFDFAIAGMLLLGTGLAIEAALRFVTKPSHRLAICAGILLVLVIAWIELAVGLFGSPLAGS